MVPPVLRGEATWSELRKYGIGWWVRSNDTLRRLIEKVKKIKNDVYDMKMFMQLNLSTTATLGTEKNDRRREVAVVEKFKQESLYCLSATKSGRCREMAVSGGSTVS